MSKRTLESEDDFFNPPTTPKRPRQTILSNTLTPTIPTLPPNATVSAPIEDRKSKFIGYFIPLTHQSTLARHRTLLESLPELKLADHKIMAWNIGQSTGFDDDGEKWAGRKVLDILTTSDDEGLLCVVRWYGGIMLGPARFDHIVHVAADALATYHLSQKKSPIMTTPTRTAPKIMENIEDEERTKLMRMLGGKDMTVDSLRTMIVAKKAERGESPVSSPVKEKRYDRMGVEGLKRLLTARDATIKSLREIYAQLNSTGASTESEVQHTQGKEVE
jgi:hypothetical protein